MDDLTVVGANWLNYYEASKKIDLQTAKYAEVLAMLEGGLDRYRYDRMFRAHVDHLTSHLLTLLETHEQDNDDRESL